MELPIAFPAPGHLMPLASAGPCSHVHIPIHRNPHIHIINSRKSFYKASGRTLTMEVGRLVPDSSLLPHLLQIQSPSLIPSFVTDHLLQFPLPHCPISIESGGSSPPNSFPHSLLYLSPQSAALYHGQPTRAIFLQKMVSSNCE